MTVRDDSPGSAAGAIVSSCNVSARQGDARMLRDRSIPALLSVTGAAELLDSSRQYVNRLINEGRLPAAWAGSTLVLAKATVQAFQSGEVFSAPHTLEVQRYDTAADQWRHVKSRVVGPDYEAPELLTVDELGLAAGESYRVEVRDHNGRSIGLVRVEDQ